eukprot:jgi/Galph1/1991/GphlegSOOS_G679.1
MLQPVDTCKTRAQSARKLGFRVHFFPILFDALKKEGVKSLFRGLPAAMSMYISTYESCKYFLLEKTHFLPRNVGIALAASVGDMIAGFVRVPPEMVKQRLQLVLKDQLFQLCETFSKVKVLKVSIEGILHKMSVPLDDFYRVKRVRYKDRNVAICLQNQNGPCPLLAIVNCLLLRGSIEIHEDIAYTSYQQLAEMLTDYLFRTHENSAGEDANLAQIVMDVVSIIPRLQTGVDVNVRFKQCESFEYTVELSAFDAFRVRLVHGWIVDSKDSALQSVIDDLSYNQLVDFVVSNDEIREPVHESKVEKDVSQEDVSTASHCEDDKVKKDEKDGRSTEPQDTEHVGVSSDSILKAPTDEVLKEDTEGKSNQVGLVDDEIDSILKESVSSSDPERAPKNMNEKPTCNKRIGTRRCNLFVFGTDEARGASPIPTEENISSDIKQETYSPRTKSAIIREFLADTSNQLTNCGLEELKRTVQEDELCVFFRNNHFSAMTKHLDNLYLLVSDVGFAEESQVVWEKIKSIHGDSEFFNSDFQSAISMKDSLSNPSATSVNTDEQLAAQLQAQENQGLTSSANRDTDYELAKKLQKEEQTKSSPSQKGNVSSHHSRASPKHNPSHSPKSREKSDKKSGCSIQ